MSKITLQIFILAMVLVSGAGIGSAQEAAMPADAPAAVVDNAVDAVVNEVKAVADAAAPVAEPVAAVATEQPAMTEEEKAKQAIMMEYMTVNEHHEFLKSLAGNWTTKVKFWMDPAGQPEESEGTSEAKIIMSGRFLEQTYNGTVMGQPFEGRGILGYDNLKKEYTSIWFDNMATGIMTGSGQYNPDSKILLAEGTMSCPMTQETKRWYRDVTTFIDADNYTYETYMKDKNGMEYKSMVISYSRAQ